MALEEQEQQHGCVELQPLQQHLHHGGVTLRVELR